MARQNKSTKTDTTQENTVTENTEAVEATEKVEIDLTAFQTAVTEALAEGDTSTGQLPETAVAKVNAEYRKLDGLAAKNAARKHLDDGMLDAVGKLDAVSARGYSDLKGNLSAAGGPKAEKAPADPVVAFVQRHAALQLAQYVVNGEAPEIPEGRDVAAEIEALVKENVEALQAQVAYLADDSEDKGDGPELNPVIRAAFKAASGKAAGGKRGGSTGGPRRDIAKHIESAFAEVESGTFLSVAEIAKHKSAEYGDDHPSQGAVSARLFPASGKVTVEGIVPVNKAELDGKNPKGASKA